MNTLIIVILAILFTTGIWWIGVSNSLNRQKVRIKEAESGIDVALNKRYDVLVKMIGATKGYAKHEKEVQFEAVKLREGMGFDDLQKASKAIESNLDKVNFLAENYPDLKASQTFIELQDSIVDTEEHLQAARRCYNSSISRFNQAIVTFPQSIVARSKHLTEAKFFEAPDEKKKDVKMDF